MLSKEELEELKVCEKTDHCYECSFYKTGRIYDKECQLRNPHENISRLVIIETALQLLNRAEKSEQLLRDVLVSGNVKSCEKAIREVLEGGD